MSVSQVISSANAPPRIQTIGFFATPSPSV